MSNATIKDVTEKTRYLLWAKSAGRCQLEGCNHPLYEDDLTQIELNFGKVAHIIGQGQTGPRNYKDLGFDFNYVNDLSNLMLLCGDHHDLVDKAPDKFPTDLLRGMKKRHEDRIRLATGMKVDRASNIIIYRGRIGSHQPSINFEDAKKALFPEYFPANHYHHELSMDGVQLSDDDPSYWKAHEKNLESAFHKNVERLFNNNQERNHFSIFAFAPIPLLVKLGSLIPDHYPAQVYQLKKYPQTWEWEQDPHGFDYFITEPEDNQKIVALNLSLSADIDSQRIYKALNTEEVSIWKMDITDIPFPKNDHLRGKGQLVIFSRYFRKLLNQIKEKHGQDTTLHIFPAVSIAYAVEMGRVRQPKADLPFVIYDQNNKVGGFIPTLIIE